MNSNLLQNICIICLESDNLKLYNEEFGCNCQCFFHEKCWELFVNNDFRCPLCRKSKREKNKSQRFLMYLELIIFNVFLILLIQVYGDLKFVIFYTICGLSCLISSIYMVCKQSRKYLYIYVFVNLFFAFFAVVSIQSGLFEQKATILYLQKIRIFSGLILALISPYLFYHT